MDNKSEKKKSQFKHKSPLLKISLIHTQRENKWKDNQSEGEDRKITKTYQKRSVHLLCIMNSKTIMDDNIKICTIPPYTG